MKKVWEVWKYAIGSFSDDKTAPYDNYVAGIRTIIFVSYMVTNAFIVSGVIRHWNNNNGKLAEWFIAPVLKTGEGNTSEGSNPSLSSTGCSSVWQSTRFGSEWPQVQILSPRLLIHNGKMQFYSVEYWQSNWDTLIDRVEKGETIGIENENGDRAVMVPADDELIRLYTDHSEGS